MSTELVLQPLQSSVDIAFWSELASLKLNTLKLSEEAVDLQGSISSGQHAEVATPLQLDMHSLSATPPEYTGQVHAPGQLYNFNTMEKFKGLTQAGDANTRAVYVRQAVAQIWRDIVSGAALQNPILLWRFIAISYAELKKYHFYYWFCFPALLPPEPFTGQTVQLSSPGGLGDASEQIVQRCIQYAASEPGNPACWIISLASTADTANAADAIAMHPLTSWAEASAVPGRDFFKGTFSAGRSLLLHAKLPAIPGGWQPQAGLAGLHPLSWETNARGKLGPRMVPLGSSLDTHRLAEIKCLLLGAGTLGCAVARTLLGWGIRKITLLDNARVAFSNPVRQSLFTFGDCLDGGRPKAEAAAQALQSIFPSVNAVGVQMSVPMPGHPIGATELAQVQADAQQLDQLMQEHDAVFLLMDTREARWLPTLLAAAHGKLAINAALGFDSYLVMRHGVPAPSGTAGHVQLGCYFCNDIIAPLDSTLDRSLDQQCTVARPGLAAIAGSLAVELMATVLQHPFGPAAPAPAPDSAASASKAASTEPPEAAASPLGTAPHRIQGRLSAGFVQHTLSGRASPQCTACSPAIVQACQQQGLPFIIDMLQDPRKLLDLTRALRVRIGLKSSPQGERMNTRSLTGTSTVSTTETARVPNAANSGVTKNEPPLRAPVQKRKLREQPKRTPRFSMETGARIMVDDKRTPSARRLIS
ncbi:hypothetical protein WJX73_006008 [Symbiochloris irregularis]|uniref:Ubiquitin-like modifier-activating enzyme ATG7 n=1 Tax=Symbiochloris irregularis TaxID=706552 RepID=A0AAW1PI42_9CHLO